MRRCFAAKVSGTPSSLHCARSVPSGFTVVGTLTRASRAKSSRNSSPGSPIILYDAPETWAEVIGTSRSASESRATVRRSRIDVRWAGEPSSRRRRCAVVSRTQSPPARTERASCLATSGFAGNAISFSRTSIGSVSCASVSFSR